MSKIFANGVRRMMIGGGRFAHRPSTARVEANPTSIGTAEGCNLLIFSDFGSVEKSRSKDRSLRQLLRCRVTACIFIEL
ncbi:hypothetical protein [Pseudomonas mandelii]|uniref:hypothetical protein n=1 Tax=Pseudomonas mandelii TaxID=75612 RepID=UPI00209E9917|nr:hypothetical protein [Pseudomonas mandelii]MCO8310014.1 hypothetical protein [Pseudomonas mandelii]